MMTLHRANVSKLLNDPEIFKACDLSTSQLRSVVEHHVETLQSQLLRLVKEAIVKRRLRNAEPERMAVVLSESMIAFYHPKLVAQHIHEKREPLLRLVLDNVLKGLDLTS